ncbi:MAG: hypothetical protein L3J34_05465 [Flavobacteriaceae bacterium]|nr:hypothetical protein [Flavobacteriaceae bacterium]
MNHTVYRVLKIKYLLFMIPLLIFSCNVTGEKSTSNHTNLSGIEVSDVEKFNNITLELSLKPFKENNPAYISKVCQEIFTQWGSLLRRTDTISLMLWTADGSEILDYSGSLDQPLEWAKYMGNPNTKHEVNSSPDENLILHERAFTYMDNPPEFSYNDLKFIVATLKKTGERMTGKPIRVGATFDPGPEFAKSEFKYKKHPEICIGNTMGSKTFVVCYATLNEDKNSYAGFPNGIKQDTPFGTFFGRQSEHFLSDLGFDYLWLSNGFGFGMETWSATGAVFDGEKFYPEKIADTRKKIIDFWSLFRKECPEFRIETRGTNLSTGIDLAADGVDLKSIYNGNFNILPPPNSPWAALNGDFGLELAGYMSRIAELPDSRYLFRYYTHDPWWINSPWLDRYGREPHDIYLPMAISRINEQGVTTLPTHLNFLTIDNTFGDMPVQVPDEVMPHILQARRNAPDQAGPVVWVYPFDEYHNWATNQPERLEEIYYGDWFIRQAINEGFPMNSVVSTKNFITIEQSEKSTFKESILVSIVPDEGSELEKQLMDFVIKGGKLIVYGPITNGGKDFLKFLNIKSSSALFGEFQIKTSMDSDWTERKESMRLRHTVTMSGGGIESELAKPEPETKVLAQVFKNSKKRDVVVLRQLAAWNGGAVCYIRGTSSLTYKGGHLLTPDDPDKWFSGPSLMRSSLGALGYSIRYSKKSERIKDPINCISRHDNAFYISGYVSNQTVEQQFKFPQGAPLFIGTETELKAGFSTYRFPKAYQKESRLFVEQQDGIVSCYEIHSGEKGIERRIGIKGLKNATIRFYPPQGVSLENIKAYNNSGYPYKEGQIKAVKEEKYPGHYYLFKNINGQLIVSW